MELIQKVQNNWKYFLINIHIVAQGADKSDPRKLGVRQDGVFGFLLRVNQGLKSRVPGELFFPDFAAAAVVEMAQLQMTGGGHILSTDAVAALPAMAERLGAYVGKIPE